MPESELLKLLVIGAHPDDAEYKAGGLAALYRELGHEVRFISVTDGGAGHHRIAGRELAERRRAEAGISAAVLGLTYEVWDFPDGKLVPSIEAREAVIRAIRNHAPDLILTHRPNDYHPDHRAVALLVQDSCYMLTVPAICPDTPHLAKDPVVAYLSDDFQRPYPFEPSVLVDVEAVWNEKIEMLVAHESQFFEWLPANRGQASEVPEDREERWNWLSESMKILSRRLADRYRRDLVRRFGPERGREVSLVEAFEISEYGAIPDDLAIRRLFPRSGSPAPNA